MNIEATPKNEVPTAEKIKAREGALREAFDALTIAMQDLGVSGVTKALGTLKK